MFSRTVGCREVSGECLVHQRGLGVDTFEEYGNNCKLLMQYSNEDVAQSTLRSMQLAVKVYIVRSKEPLLMLQASQHRCFTCRASWTARLWYSEAPLPLMTESGSKAAVASRHRSLRLDRAFLLYHNRPAMSSRVYIAF